MNMTTMIGRTRLRVADLGDGAEVDRIKQFVHESEGATPFHLPTWSQAVADGTRQEAHYLLAERGGGIAGVLPLTAVRSRLFGDALVSAGFAVGGGILSFPFSIVGGVGGAVFPDQALAILVISSSIGSVLQNAFVAPFTSAVTTLQYMDQRMRKEAYDVELMREAGLIPR